MEEREGEQPMEIRLDTESNPDLTQDVRRLQDKIGDALDFYFTLRDKYGELNGWEMVEDKLGSAGFWAQTPLEIFEDEEW
jgi:hypothetical protein